MRPTSDPCIRSAPVNLGDVGAAWMVWLLLAWENRHEDNPSARRLCPKASHNSADALDDFRRGVLAGIGSIARIVRAEVKHDDAWVHSVQFAVVQAPEDVLNAVPAKAEIQGPVEWQSRLPPATATSRPTIARRHGKPRTRRSEANAFSDRARPDSTDRRGAWRPGVSPGLPGAVVAHPPLPRACIPARPPQSLRSARATPFSSGSRSLRNAICDDHRARPVLDLHR